MMVFVLYKYLVGWEMGKGNKFHNAENKQN